MSIWSSIADFASVAASTAGPIVSVANPALGAGLTAGGSLIGSLSKDYKNSKQHASDIAVSRDENALNRQFNSDEAFKQRSFEAQQAKMNRDFNARQADLSYQRNKEMWQLENEYNSPTAQIARLKEAGLNPNLFNGQNTGGSIASATPVGSSSSPVGASASYGSGISTAPVNYSNPSLDAAQARLMNAQADDLESQTNRRDSLLPGEIKKQGADFDFVNSEINLNTKRGKEIDARCQQIAKDMEYTDKLIQQSEAYKRLLTLQGDEKEKELAHFEERFIKEMRALDDKHLIDEKELEVMASQIKKNLAEASAANSVAALNGIEFSIKSEYGEKMAKIQYDMEKKKYNVVVDDAKTSKAENRVKRAKASHDYEVAKKRGIKGADSYYGVINHGLDELQMVTDALNGSVNVGIHSNSVVTSKMK